MPIKETIWEKEPHTEAKHAILEEHLKGWFPVLSRFHGRVVYLDGFAGPGLYSKGEEGSPTVAIKTANEHVLKRKFGEISFVFIEKDKERAKTLEEVIKDRFPNLSKNLSYSILNGEFATNVESMLDHLDKEGLKLAPTFAFLDPFGYSKFPMSVVSKLLSQDQCEVFITFMIRDVNRFTDPLHENALDEFFGTNDWRRVRGTSDPEERKKILLDVYVNQLKIVGNAKYVKTFEMRDRRNQTIYYLIFATKHLKGLEVMKEAMFRVDGRGTHRFSDLSDPNQTYLLDYDEKYWMEQPAKQVYQEFKGKTVTLKKIKEFVYDKTPFVFRKSVLSYLEESEPSKITHVTNRKNPKLLSYHDDCEITFTTL